MKKIQNKTHIIAAVIMLYHLIQKLIYIQSNDQSLIHLVMLFGFIVIGYLVFLWITKLVFDSFKTIMNEDAFNVLIIGMFLGLVILTWFSVFMFGIYKTEQLEVFLYYGVGVQLFIITMVRVCVLYIYDEVLI